MHDDDPRETIRGEPETDVLCFLELVPPKQVHVLHAAVWKDGGEGEVH